MLDFQGKNVSLPFRMEVVPWRNSEVLTDLFLTSRLSFLSILSTTDSTGVVDMQTQYVFRASSIQLLLPYL
jgi:hypothetical protein